MEQVEKLKKSLELLENKKFKIFFVTPDSMQGTVNPGSTIQIYKHAKLLIELGYNAIILHEKNEYSPIDWLGSGYDIIPHESIESKNVNISVEDFVIIPELLGNALPQFKNIPSKVIMLSQCYDYILDLLSPGHSWNMYGVDSCITTTENHKKHIDTLFKNIHTEIVPVSINDNCKNENRLQKPIIAIHCREPRDLSKIIKVFYARYPLLRFIGFRDMHQMDQDDFINTLKNSCVSVWVDDISSFGTFPIESMKCGTPVIGKVPSMQPEWMTDTNGLWTYDLYQIPDMIAQYIQMWMEDAIPQELYDNMSVINDMYTEDIQKNKVEEVYSKFFEERKEYIKMSLEKFDTPSIKLPVETK